MIPYDRTSHKLEHRRFWLNIRKHFFTVWVTVHWHSMPRELMEFPPWKSHLDLVLGNMLEVSLLEQGGWTSRHPEIPSNLNQSVISCVPHWVAQPESPSALGNQNQLVKGSVTTLHWLVWGGKVADLLPVDCLGLASIRTASSSYPFTVDNAEKESKVSALLFLRSRRDNEIFCVRHRAQYILEQTLQRKEA